MAMFGRMKHWQPAPTQRGYGPNGIVFGRVVSIAIVDGNVTMAEECDGAHSTQCTPTEAVAMLREAIEWIESETE